MRKCKTASFDLTDEYEAQLLAHAEANGKFSKYIKRLIARDKEGQFAAAAMAPPLDPEPDNEDKEAMAAFF